ncbi:sporulation protein [Lederbergia wuyishanensis]|uniref:Sporulation-control protein n=1 Tax=Lederbergia wuyishanensis TaxID=1347903 RepID=A0ABU0D5L5_9BACI|nr:sporulation protein [Lederbergia wuyishanensis]MCJ8008288.1 sporulation protein [Lederbergia wuyishanensis]MDQ0343701.1 sporulation-control protein [Lederbergia wuyishanensis]
MLLRKYMSLIGIGSAQIDLILSKDTYKVGEHIEGYFLIKGGTIDQQLRRIDCELIKREELMGNEEIIDIQTILTSKRIESEEIYKITFSFKLPSSIFVSSEEISYCFKTKLTFNEGVESRDQDIIRII